MNLFLALVEVLILDAGLHSVKNEGFCDSSDTDWEGGKLSQDQQVEVIRDKLAEIRQKMSLLQEMENYLSIKLDELTTTF